MLEFMFRQMPWTDSQSCDKFNSSWIMTVKVTISRWCDKYKDTDILHTSSGVS